MDNAKPFSITVRGMQLAGLTWGDPTHLPLLALHGWMDNAASFAMLGPQLKNRHVIALDFPGHGLSDHRPARAANYFAEYVLDIAHVIRESGWRHCDVIGHSMGAGVASLLAGSSAMVQRLILLDGLGPIASEARDAARHLKIAVDESLQGPVAPRFYASLDELLERRQRATPYLSGAAVRLLVSRNARRDEERGWQWRTDPFLRFGSPMRFSEDGARNILEQIRCPVLLLPAKDGLFSKVDLLQQRMASVEDLSEHTIEGHHHFHMSANVEKPLALINRFLHRAA